MIRVGHLSGGASFALADRHRPGGDAARNLDNPAEAAGLARRLAASLGRHGWPLARVRQVHVRDAHEAASLVGSEAVPQGDAVVCRPGNRAIGIALGADCAVVAIGGRSGGAAAVHAGWRGLVAGCIGAGTDLLANHDTPAAAVIGPTIGPCCYAFDDPTPLIGAYGDSVVSTTNDGRRSVDLRRAADIALNRAGVRDIRHIGGCTSCHPQWFSHRARQDPGRHVLAVAARW